MVRVLKKLSSLAGNLFGGGVLTHDQKALLSAVTLQFCATAVSGVFINTFLYTSAATPETGTMAGLSIVVRYNLFFCISVCLFSAVVGVLGSRMRAKMGMMLGLAFTGALYVLLLAYGQFVGRYALLLGVFGGLGSSFYSISYNSMMTGVTGDRVRGMFVGLSGLGSAACGILLPLISGFIIWGVPRFNGYLGVFGASLILLTASAIVSLRIVSPGLPERREGILHHIARPLRSRAFAAAAAAEVVRGLPAGVMIFLAPTLLVMTGMEPVMVGVYASVCAALQVGSGFLIGRWMTPDNRVSYLLIASTATCVSCFFFLIHMGPVAVFAYGIFTSIVYAFLVSPSFEIYYHAVGTVPDVVRRTGSDMAAREFYLNLGRSLGVALLLTVRSASLIPYIVALLGVTQLLVPVFYRMAERATDTNQSL